MNQKTRNEISNEYKWDLTSIYQTDEDWYKDYEIIKKQVTDVKKFEGTITKSAKELLDYLEFSNSFERRLYKLYYYAHLKHDEDTTNSTYQEMNGKISDLISIYSENDAFANPELMSVDYDTIKKFYSDEPKLKDYEFVLEQLYRYKPHILDNQSEQLLSMISQVFNAPEETYEALTDSDIKFGYIKDGDGNDVELTDSNYSKFIHSRDREVRKKAFERYHEVYGSYKNTIASTYANEVNVLTSVAKVRHYKSSIEASLFADNIDVEVYDNLINTISNHLDVIYKYFALKKEVLGLDELHLYDIYLEMVKDLDKEYTFEEAKELVLKALSVLGDDYVAILNKAFDEKWIDVYNNVGKRSGAYSSGFYDTNPFILLNYEGKLKDVSTLAHELGHSVHTYLSCHNNNYQYSSYQIFVAEVASTVNELLLNHYLLKVSTDEKEKQFILNSMMELFKGPIYRQVMFAEFEKTTHQKKEQGEVLTNQMLSDIYYDLNKKYFGENVVIDDLIKYEWSRIPHFYYNFYVYKYAIGLSCACYIVDGIINNREKAVENYLAFLKTGGSMYPADELKVAGIDVTKSDVVISAIKMFDGIIDQFRELYNKEN